MPAGRVPFAGYCKRLCSSRAVVVELALDSSDARFLYLNHQCADAEIRGPNRTLFSSSRLLAGLFWRDHNFNRQLVAQRIFSRKRRARSCAHASQPDPARSGARDRALRRARSSLMAGTPRRVGMASAKGAISFLAAWGIAPGN